MTDGNTKSGIEMRKDERVDFAEPVTIEFDGTMVVGYGENISAQGVYLTTESAIRVKVRVEDGSLVDGELVRAEAMGDGRVGIAIRFSESKSD